jgi:Na+-driven multidrug efflux pump
VGYDAALLAMTCRGFRLYSLSFLLTGFNIFSSGFFTALNDGFVSAVISFLRTLVFQTAVVLVLPALMGTDGIWLAIVVAELLALAVSAWFLWRKRGKYRYA